jgi:hypothetical protein
MIARFVGASLLSKGFCDLCHGAISSTQAVAVLAREEASKVLVHISCLAADLPDPAKAHQVAS